MKSCQTTLSKVVGGVLGVGLLLVVLGALPASAAPCLVPSSVYPTIQAAVNDTTCATINVAAGTYTEHVTIYRHATIDHDVMIRGEGEESTIVDGSGSGTVFRISRGTVTIKGVTIQNGAAGFGGGIFKNFDSTLTVQNSTISGNAADFGGGIFNESGGTLTVRNSTIADNHAGSDGGGIANQGTLLVKNTTFSNNGSHDGGGISSISSRGAVTVKHSIFDHNTAECGGAICSFGGSLTVQNSTFTRNGGQFGGAILTDSLVIIHNSVIADNTAAVAGGGIYNQSNGTLSIKNSTLADNSAGSDGGGIFNDNGAVTLTHVTFENNTPNDCTGCP